MSEFRSTRELVDLWAAKLPDREYFPDGSEKPSSVLRRIVFSTRFQADADHAAPGLRLVGAAPTERARLERARAELERERADLETRYHAETPEALERMGLEQQEILALAALEARPSVATADAWFRGTRPFLVLGGHPGAGKTIAAVSVLIPAATRRGGWSTEAGDVLGPHWETALAKFVKAQALARMSIYGEESERAVERLKLVGLLVIDDLGAEAKSEPWTALFDELVDARTRHGVRTVITTNLSSKQMRARYGERVLRRLLDFGQLVAVGPPEPREAEVRA